MDEVGATAVGVTAIRSNLEFKIIINIGSTVISGFIYFRVGFRYQIKSQSLAYLDQCPRFATMFFFK